MDPNHCCTQYSMYIPGRVAGKQAHPGGAGNLDNNSSREKKDNLAGLYTN